MKHDVAQWGVAQFGIRDAEVIQVIRTTLERRGEGVENDPIRRITQYWTLDGDLLAEVDPWDGEAA